LAGESIFPQIPSTVWRGVWSLLRKSPNRRLDDATLAIELNVQPAAAKQYVNELARLKILESDGAPTALAGRWRQDGDDKEIISEILQNAYPDALLQLAPIEDLNRDKIVRWFMNQNLGEGAAKNKAATYIRIASGVSAVDAPASRDPSIRPAQAAAGQSSSSRRTANTSPAGNPTAKNVPPSGQKSPELHVNVQVHISADASSEQIDAIFSSMKRYFS
jgi:hypothetical protein